MIKIAHESPKSIFKQVQACTDYDYALVHLFEEDPEYLQMFKDAVAEGREVILDNSIFELGTAFDPERFVYWINELNPTWYIVPDVLEDHVGTRRNMEDWLQNWKPKVKVPSKMIGVAQGKTFNAVSDCYDYMVRDARVDKIAISFDYSYYELAFPHPNKLISWAMGRVRLLNYLDTAGVLDKRIPHHLLGCAIPGEGIFYTSPEYDYIDSMDTSNPVVHGLKRIPYKGPLGLEFKSSEKLYTLINSEVDSDQWNTVRFNIENFKRLWRGNYGI